MANESITSISAYDNITKAKKLYNIEYAYAYSAATANEAIKLKSGEAFVLHSDYLKDDSHVMDKNGNVDFSLKVKAKRVSNIWEQVAAAGPNGNPGISPSMTSVIPLNGTSINATTANVFGGVITNYKDHIYHVMANFPVIVSAQVIDSNIDENTVACIKHNGVICKISNNKVNVLHAYCIKGGNNQIGNLGTTKSAWNQMLPNPGRFNDSTSPTYGSGKIIPLYPTYYQGGTYLKWGGDDFGLKNIIPYYSVDKSYFGAARLLMDVVWTE